MQTQVQWSLRWREVKTLQLAQAYCTPTRHPPVPLGNRTAESQGTLTAPAIVAGLSTPQLIKTCPALG